MDQIQKSLCDIKNQKPACLKDRNILRSVLADFLPNNRLKQNLLLNVFDSDVVHALGRHSDVTLTALTCISQLENDYGMTKDAAFWAIQTWCCILGLDSTTTALEILQPANEQNVQTNSASASNQKEYHIGLGVYRAGIAFPVGEISVQVATKASLDIHYGVGKNPNRINTNQYFMDKMYVNIEDGHYLKLESFETGVSHQFIVKVISGVK